MPLDTIDDVSGPPAGRRGIRRPVYVRKKTAWLFLHYFSRYPLYLEALHFSRYPLYLEAGALSSLSVRPGRDG